MEPIGVAIIDGQKEAVVSGNDRIGIRVSDEKLTFIELKNSFYDRLREKLIKGNYKTYDVMKLNVYINDQLFGKGINDVVIHTARISKIRKFSVYINDRFMENTSADGVIIATPIGSTSYSYSAGGPILIPSLKAMVISYIAPFGSRLRPIVCPDNTKITIKIIGKFSSLAIIDGQKEAVVSENDRIDIRVSDEKLTFIELKNSFYDRLREKLIKDVVN